MIQRMDRKRQRRAAFTLMEMLVVVAIIVALAGIGGFFLLGQLFQSQKDIAAIQAKALGEACQRYAIKHNGEFPNQLDDLLVKDGLGGPYLESRDAMLDPWGHPYQYDKTGPNNNSMRPDIWAVDKEGNKIGNWPKNQTR